MGKIKDVSYRFLSGKKATLFIVALVVGSRLLQLLYLFSTRNDMSYQLQAAQALYDGHGVSLPKIFADDLSFIHYQPLVQWPPGFSILFVPFYVLCGQNYMLAAIIINLLSALVVIFFSRGILKQLQTPLYLLNCFTVLTGFSLYYFYLKPCTDSTAIAFLIMALYFTLSLFKSNRHFVVKTFAIAVTLLCCGFIKYMYLPVVFILPLFILGKGFVEKKTDLKKAAFFLSTALLIISFAFIIYQQQTTHSVGYIKEPARGFYPENILSTHPFIPAAFIKPETLEWFTHWPPLATTQAVHVFQAIHLLLFITLIIIGGRYFFKKKKKQPAATDFFLMALMVSLVVTAILTWLSLHVAKESIGDRIFWTYVEEPRYYGALHIFLHLAAFLLYQIENVRRSFKRFFYFLFVCLFMEMMRGLVFTANRIIQVNKEVYGWQQELRFEQHAAQLVNAEKTKQQMEQVVLAGSSDWFTLRAGLYCQLPIFEKANKLNNLSGVNTKIPVLLFVIMQKEQLVNFGAFINSTQTKYVGTADGFLFYTHIIKPH